MELGNILSDNYGSISDNEEMLATNIFFMLWYGSDISVPYAG